MLHTIAMGGVVAGHYRDLVVWQKSMDLVEVVYDLSDSYPKREIYSLADQTRRAVVSVASNIAEGQAHQSHREFIRFLRLARGSLAEVETQIEIGARLHYIKIENCARVLEAADEIGRMIAGLIASIQRKLEEEQRSSQNEEASAMHH